MLEGKLRKISLEWAKIPLLIQKTKELTLLIESIKNFSVCHGQSSKTKYLKYLILCDQLENDIVLEQCSCSSRNHIIKFSQKNSQVRKLFNFYTIRYHYWIIRNM